ncbi:MAG: histidine phosphatase family protein [Candidatus Saccharimonadales bacterium]
MKVYVVRHAETNYNVLGLCNDDPNVDVHLTQNGVKQAESLAKTLEAVDFDLVITSDLSRTKETAKIIVGQDKDIPTIVDVRISDTKSGFEGRPVSEFRAARSSAPDIFTASFNGGESIEDQKVRVSAFLDDLKKMDKTCVLIVTHQSIARLIHASIFSELTKADDDLDIGNTYCFDFEY